MKKLFVVGLLGIILLLTGCNSNIVPKTEFRMNEQANIDKIDIKLTKAVRSDNNLEVTFEITNRRDNAITISPDKNFVLYENKTQVLNKFQNLSNVLKKDQTVMYTLSYDISKRELYEIYFYSGIVENNIKFTIDSLDFKGQ